MNKIKKIMSATKFGVEQKISGELPPNIPVTTGLQSSVLYYSRFNSSDVVEKKTV